ncbi:hypothetical protein [Litoribaculum gwangyangense]|uniref:Uncharacterized protein n=1 Tax=Litoribaculum gwangyangense TaxID=1130722 RepID=A0ABP9BX35_9FLAO
MKFKLNKQELNKFYNWKKQLTELETVDVWGQEFQYEFIFQPTGLGVIKIVRRTDGEEINLTDFSNW